MDSRTQQPPGGVISGPWSRPDQPANAGADDPLIVIATAVLAFLAATLIATVALAVTAIVYGLATWRRWRWVALALPGAACLLLALALAGPDVLDTHLLAIRELTDTKGVPVADLAADRWPAWLAAQLPLSVPVGLLFAGLARHQVTRVPAHELSPRARHRREAEDRAQLQKAVRDSAAAPTEHGGKPVLGAWVSGDLDGWHSGRWATIPERHLGLGTLLVGLPGAGKTETLLRLADLALRSGWDVHIIDAKGDAATQQRFAALAAANNIQPRLFPADPYDGFRGDPEALRNRLARIVDYTEPYYQDGARVLLHAACHPRLGTFDDLIARLTTAGDVDPAVRKGTLSRYRSFAGAVGECLTGGWAFEDTRASYLLLDGLGMGDDTPRLARYLLEDFSHFASTRKDPARNVLLLVDEFSALRVSNAAALFERLRSFNAGVVLAAQSVEGLHDEPAERDRLLNATSTIIVHRLADPEPVVARAGSVRRAERSHQLDVTGPTGQGSLRIQDTYRVDPNEVRSLPPGVAWVISGGRAAKVAVAASRPATSTPAPTAPPPTTAPVAPIRPADSPAEHVEPQLVEVPSTPTTAPVPQPPAAPHSVARDDDDGEDPPADGQQTLWSNLPPASPTEPAEPVPPAAPATEEPTGSTPPPASTTGYFRNPTSPAAVPPRPTPTAPEPPTTTANSATPLPS